MMLEIQELGLATTWIGSFDPQKLIDTYHIPDYLVPVVILPVGYPSKDSKPSINHLKRKEIDEFVFWNKMEEKED